MKKLGPVLFVLGFVACSVQMDATIDPNYQPPVGGAPPGPGPTPVDPAFSGPVVCTSGVMWTRGDRGSANMHPGHACIDCHSSEDDAPTFSVAGTVYPSGHEPDDCNGVDDATLLRVIITDSTDKVLTLKPNSAGNFYSRTRITPPYTAKVTDGTKTREMSAHQETGDCNSCHTETGTDGAPGRIVAP